VRKEDLKASLDKIKPDEAAKRRMRYNIMNYNEEKTARPILRKRAVPALALVLVLTAGIFAYDKIFSEANTYKPPVLSSEADDYAREDMAAPIVNQFKFEDRDYIILSDELRKEFGLPSEIRDGDIGDKLGTITQGPDEKLIGKEVYEYIPADCEAIVAVKDGDSYKLFRFFNFESYKNNIDEDAERYLKLFGIKSAEDISKVQFILYSEEAKLRGGFDIKAELKGKDEIKKFYDFYSGLKNSSDEYFKALYNYRREGIDHGKEVYPPVPDTAVSQIAPDAPNASSPVFPDGAEPAYYADDLPAAVPERANGAATPANDGNLSTVVGHRGIMDIGETGVETVTANQGSAGAALENAVTIRIYNKNGIYYDTIYYPNIGFISRYKLGDNFKAFLNSYVK